MHSVDLWGNVLERVFTGKVVVDAHGTWVQIRVTERRRSGVIGDYVATECHWCCVS